MARTKDLEIIIYELYPFNRKSLAQNQLRAEGEVQEDEPRPDTQRAEEEARVSQHCLCTAIISQVFLRHRWV